MILSVSKCYIPRLIKQKNNSANILNISTIKYNTFPNIFSYKYNPIRTYKLIEMQNKTYNYTYNYKVLLHYDAWEDDMRVAEDISKLICLNFSDVYKTVINARNIGKDILLITDKLTADKIKRILNYKITIEKNI